MLFFILIMCIYVIPYRIPHPQSSVKSHTHTHTHTHIGIGYMFEAWHGNTVHIIGHLCWESYSHNCFPSQSASNALMFSLVLYWTCSWRPGANITWLRIAVNCLLLERHLSKLMTPKAKWQGGPLTCITSNTSDSWRRHNMETLSVLLVLCGECSDVIMSAMASQITSLTIAYRLFRRRSKKTSKLRVIDIYAGNSPMTGEFRAQRANNEENVSFWWRHHGSPVASPHWSPLNRTWMLFWC